MSDPDLDTNSVAVDFKTAPSAKQAERASFVISQLKPPIHYGFLRAIELAPAELNGFHYSDIERVEACWEIVDVELDVFGFVIVLTYGRRTYLQYICDRLESETKEELQILPMGDELYPQLKGGGVVWSREVKYLNNLLTH